VESAVVGFVGLGRMGGRMARRVIGRGFVVHAFDVLPGTLEPLVVAGARACSSPAEVAEKSDVVITVLPSGASVEAAVLGEGGIASSIRPGSVLMEMSTIAPSLSRRLSVEIQDRGAEYLDCPMSGGIPGAEKGNLTVMVGGKSEVLDNCRPVLEPMAKNIFHMGEVGAGLTTKLINQLLTMTQTVLTVEALAIGARAGVELSTLYDVVSKSSGGSWCWENRIPRILKGEAGAWVTIDICQKDLALATQLAEELGIPQFVSTGAFQVLQMAKSMGMGGEDVAVLGDMYDRMLGTHMRPSEEQR